MNKSMQNTREMLRKLGVGEIHATIAQYQAFFLPRSTRADATATMILTKALQRGLVKAGCHLEVDGVMGPETARCLSQVSGPKWLNKTWIRLAEDVLRAEKFGIGAMVNAPPPVSMVLSGDEVSTRAKVSSLLLAGAVLLGAFMFKK